MAPLLQTFICRDASQALVEVAVEAALDLSRGEPSTLLLLRAAEAHTLPGADPTAAQVAVLREAETYLVAVADGLAEAREQGRGDGV